MFSRLSSRDIGAVCAAGVIRVVEISLGGLGVENPQRGSGRSPEVLGLGLCLAARFRKGGAASCGLRGCPPPELRKRRRAFRGETTRPCPHDLNFFLRGVCGGAWNGAQAEVARARNGLALSPQKRARAAGAGA